ncbi:mobilization protein [Gordonibacter sp. Marseille-P4307]|uniref:plasmid mobilization protein n=1 Tax=Gordonibacter sp. Marseille-P4307 TaxID=2161815 RepID=UPI000F51FB7B|nr:mobilization protein [Gordonibacter sp. Marseille-P4307]
MPCPNYRRKRTISKAFRVSREEGERIELLAKAAGVTQQEYIMAKLEDREFTVVPDIRTYKMLRDSMRQIYQELCRLRDCSTMDERLIAKIELLSDLFVGIAGDAEHGELEKEDSLIADMERE